ncbi:ABC transporter substrate-binding protein [Leucobacter denitrificans]|uniref:Extracellular solute-binding protein n=1 Tax=Leucobacter denitrificans TaxID=683042 RepID=A0A7G9S3E4_9MICO|nr:extracellular solute-binding protein [Leucobacter denitrificans]QNN62369.1 extracellular solute-binding protein [Leucobacter denitrificans]
MIDQPLGASVALEKRSPLRRGLKVLVPLVAASLVLSACAGNGGAATDGETADSQTSTDNPVLQELYEAAQAAGENQVNVLTAGNDADFADPNSGLGYVGAQFEEQFPGITIEWTGTLGTAAFANLDGQAQSGNYSTDVVMYSTTSGILNHQADEGRFLSYAPKIAEELGADSRGPDDTYTVAYSSGIGMMYNTSMYEEGDLPTTLDELMSSEWAGKFGMTEPNGAWPADVTMASLGEAGEMTEAEIKSLLSNAELYQDMPTALSALAQGRTGVILWAPASVAMNMQRTGAPIGLASMDRMFLQRNGLGIAAEAPSLNLAKLFVEWAFSENGQNALNEGWFAYGEMSYAPDRDDMPPASEFTVPQLPVHEEANTRQIFFTDVVQPILESVK